MVSCLLKGERMYQICNIVSFSHHKGLKAHDRRQTLSLLRIGREPLLILMLAEPPEREGIYSNPDISRGEKAYTLILIEESLQREGIYSKSCGLAQAHSLRKSS